MAANLILNLNLVKCINASNPIISNTAKYPEGYFIPHNHGRD